VYRQFAEWKKGAVMIHMHNVSKTLGNFQLDNISMELPEGYIMGLIGPNGAGKTSLLHILLGLYQPEEGC
ncbi:MAG: ATP-binding cassette domain-containing protein, partial [Lachnospiraceae bacterium]|nr:ATP-binding cassette domain-containing protein [Lachnospiraceae bacterium]